jgi:spore germination protein YaaH
MTRRLAKGTRCALLIAPLVLWPQLGPAAVAATAVTAAPPGAIASLVSHRSARRGVSSAARGAAAACVGRSVRRLRVHRLHGTRARLTWSAPSGADGAWVVYRVLRAGRTVGQTASGSIVLRITPGLPTTYTVQARYANGPGVCATRLRATLAFRAPGRVAGLRILARSVGGASIGWRAALRGDAPVAGYRVERDGAVVAQTRGLTFDLRLSPARSHRVTVAAVDTRGNVGPASATLTIAAGPHVATAGTAPTSQAAEHAPPTAPSLLAAVSVSDTSATLSWNEGSVNGATLVGYMLYQDGEAVGVIHGQIATVALASDRHYVFTVRTLDSSGDLSAPSPELMVVTTHTPPPPPTALQASQVTSQSAHLSWAPSTAVSGTIVGYRVFRDEIPVGQTATPEMTLQNLAPSSEYQITVTAVDSLGAISPPTEPLTVHTAEPPPTHGDVQAYLLSSEDQSFFDLEAHYQQIGVVYPTYFECGPGGEVQGSDDALETDWAAARKIAVMPRVNCQNVTDEDQILNEPRAREAMIGKLAALCASDGFQGVQIDFEGAQPSERNPFTAFITLLAERLHAQGDKLSTDVTAKYYNIQTGRAAMYDDAALSGPSDYVFVLDWGLHWTTSAPGSIDEYGWFKRVAEYTATMPNRGKFVLGMPLYGIDWANGGGSANPGTPLQYNQITALVSEFGITPEWEATAQSPHFAYTDGEGVHHEVWYVDQQSLSARATLADSLGLGIGLWRLGSEDQSIWELPQLGGER